MAERQGKPIYLKIIEELKTRIDSGELKGGQRVPSESVLAASYGVSRITSKRALEEMEREGLIYRVRGSGSYVQQQPRPAPARGRKGNPDSLALLLPFDKTKGRALDTIRGANDFLGQCGYLLTVQISDYDPGQEREIIHRLVGSSARGLILYPYSDRRNIDVIYKLNLQNYPLVTIDKYYEGVPVPAVVTDNFGGAYAATQYLIAKGHHNIGFSSAHNVEESVSARDRYFGYCRALSDNAIEPKDSYFASVAEIRNHIDIPTFRPVLERLLKRDDPVTAIQALNDYEAISLLKAAVEMGVRVPDQLSLVGFDNIDLSAHVEVPLTTVEQDFYQIGFRAAQLLLEQIQGKTRSPEERVTVLPAKLVERASVKDLLQR